MRLNVQNQFIQNNFDAEFFELKKTKDFFFLLEKYSCSGTQKVEEIKFYLNVKNKPMIDRNQQTTLFNKPIQNIIYISIHMDSVPVQKSLNQSKPVDEHTHQLSTIPLLDMEDPNFPSKIIETFRNIGFVIVKNHGLTPEQIDKAFQTSLNFFKSPLEDKRKLIFDPNQSKGYLGPDGEVLDEANRSNQKKQTLNIGHISCPGNDKFYPNNPEFKSQITNFFDRLFEINKKILGSIEKGLGLQSGFITEKCTKDISPQIMRILYYPELSLEEIEKAGVTRAGAHSDFGTVTMLVQKPGFGQNGLRCLSSAKQWVKVEPPDYTLVVNLGDLFQHWSNDTLISTIHKVQVDQVMLQKLKDKEIQKIPSRQSIVIFCEPNMGQILECLPNCGEPKYEPIQSHDYVIGRVKAVNGSSYS